MALTFQQVEIYLFDVHLSLYPLIAPQVVRPELAFLVNREKYNHLHRQGQPIQAPGYSLRPLRRQVRRNHFWKNYRKVWPPALPMPLADREWDLQIPFRYLPNGFDLGADLG